MVIKKTDFRVTTPPGPIRLWPVPVRNLSAGFFGES